jgi:hypothetical protein
MDGNAPTPDRFDAVVTAFAETLIRSYRERWSRGGTEPVGKVCVRSNQCARRRARLHNDYM